MSRLFSGSDALRIKRVRKLLVLSGRRSQQGRFPVVESLAYRLKSCSASDASARRHHVQKKRVVQLMKSQSRRLDLSLLRLFVVPKSVDGNVRNEDGTLNGPANPAPPGSTVTVFLTGVGTPASGSFSLIRLWNGNFAGGSTGPVYQPLPGFVAGIVQTKVSVPTGPGATGAQYLSIASRLPGRIFPTPTAEWEISLPVAVYVK